MESTSPPSGAPRLAAAPQPTASADGYALFEEITVKALIDRVEADEDPVHEDTKVLLPRGTREVERSEKRSGPENLDQAINDQAKEDDREGTGYAAIKEKNLLRKTPSKTVDVKWA